ncbi:unnamed protein product [Closterium sp. NIES-65]|nr:unnamed protein product [Closterium sp. NIES-65]
MRLDTRSKSSTRRRTTKSSSARHRMAKSSSARRRMVKSSSARRRMAKWSQQLRPQQQLSRCFFNRQLSAFSSLHSVAFMSRSLTREWQWRGTWSAQAAPALHPTHQQLSSCPASLLPFSLVFFAASPVSSRFKRKPLWPLPLCFFCSRISSFTPPRLSSSHSLFLCGPLQVEGRSVGVNTDAPSCPSPVAVQVAVVGGEGGSTPLGWDGMGEYRDGLSEPSLRVGALEQGQESQVHPLTHLLLSPFSLPSQQHPAWTTVDSPPSVHPPLPSRPPSQQPKASWRSAWLW